MNAKQRTRIKQHRKAAGEGWDRLRAILSETEDPAGDNISWNHEVRRKEQEIAELHHQATGEHAHRGQQRADRRVDEHDDPKRMPHPERRLAYRQLVQMHRKADQAAEEALG